MKYKKSFNVRESIAPGLGINVLGILLIVFAVALITSIFYTISGEKKVMQQQLDREGKRLAQSSSVFATESLLVEDYPVLSTYTEGLKQHYPDLIHIVIRRADGKIVASAKRHFNENKHMLRRYLADVVVDTELIGKIEIAISTIESDAFINQHLETMIIQSSLIFLILALMLYVFFRRKITDPIHDLVLQARHLSSGDLAHVIEVKGKTELQQLVYALNNMRIGLKQSYDEITKQNKLLDRRVAERTRDLNKANAKLVDTHAQLLQSEKMAAIGVLSAGVAHEINNPVGFVTSNIDILSGWSAELIQLIESIDHDIEPNISLSKAVTAYKNQYDFDYIKEEIPLLLKETKEGLSRVSTIVADLKGFAHIDESVWEKVDLRQIDQRNRGFKPFLVLLGHFW